MKRTTALLLFCLVPAAAGPGLDPAAVPVSHSVLRRARMPLDLARTCFPRQYVVDVTLSDQLADEMRASVARQGLPDPRFQERMPALGTVRLGLANPEYTAEERDLLCGVLNPVETIDLIVNSLVRYRDDRLFADLVRETRIVRLPPDGRPGPVCVYELTPKGNRFAYAYDDAGALVSEGWLERLTVAVDTARQLVDEVTLRKCSREYALEQSQRPAVRTSVARYVFSYDSGSGCLLPSLLMLYVNDTLNLTVGASYRSEGGHVVFDSRTLCFGPEGADHACLTMRYGPYRFDQAVGEAGPAPKPGRRTRQVRLAAELSRKAADELRGGNIRASFRTLNRLLQLYPDTPQGVEARRVLASMPRGL